MTTGIITELEGTYTADRIRRWEEEAEDMHKFFEKVVGQKVPFAVWFPVP